MLTPFGNRENPSFERKIRKKKEKHHGTMPSKSHQVTPPVFSSSWQGKGFIAIPSTPGASI